MSWHKKSFVKFILKFPLLYNSIDRYVQTLFLVLNSSLILLLSYKTSKFKQMCKDKIIYKDKTVQDECVKLIYLYI